MEEHSEIVTIEKVPPKNEHKIRLIDGQPVCISCSYRHTIKLPPEELSQLTQLGVTMLDLK